MPDPAPEKGHKRPPIQRSRILVAWFYFGGQGLVQQVVEHFKDPSPSVGTGLEVAVPPTLGPAGPLLLRYLPLALIHFVATHGHDWVLGPILHRLLHPIVQLLKRPLVADVIDQQCTLRVLVELVADLEVLRDATQVPKVHLHLGALEHDLFDAKVNADGADVPGDEALLAVPLDEARLPGLGFTHGDDLHADRLVLGQVLQDRLRVYRAPHLQVSRHDAC
mmetsp:Transcript_108497/g.187494  ORF Transcript_108497/g.187494 Transcript_108497/m.187494 type:complete len:221 (+) Transcript_108497:596-1258(+)